MPHLWALSWTYLALIHSANCAIFFLLLISQGNKGKILILWHTKAIGFTWHASFKINLINSLSWFLKAGGRTTADSTAQGCVFRSGFEAAVSISCAEGAVTAKCLQLLQPCCYSVLGHLCIQKANTKLWKSFKPSGKKVWVCIWALEAAEAVMMGEESTREGGVGVCPAWSLDLQCGPEAMVSARMKLKWLQNHRKFAR